MDCLQIEMLIFFKGEVGVHELDKGFCFIKHQDFFIMFSNLCKSFYKSSHCCKYLVLLSICLA